jgi:hypothetical protein
VTPYSPGFSAVYNGVITVSKGTVRISGTRTVANPGSSPGIRNAVKDPNIRVAKFTGSIQFDPALLKAR